MHKVTHPCAQPLSCFPLQVIRDCADPALLQPLCCEGSRHSTHPAIPPSHPAGTLWHSLSWFSVHLAAAAALLEDLNPRLRVGLAKALASYGNGTLFPEYSFIVCVFFTS